MNANDIIRRIRYTFDIKDTTMIKIFGHGGCSISKDMLLVILQKEGEPGYQECSLDQLEQFLDGMIIYKRGKKENATPPPKVFLSNNIILKKLRIALELKEEDMLEIFKLADFPLSKHELTAIFRREGHKNFKKCGDQLLRNFLNGLTIRYQDEYR